MILSTSLGKSRQYSGHYRRATNVLACFDHLATNVGQTEHINGRLRMPAMYHRCLATNTGSTPQFWAHRCRAIDMTISATTNDGRGVILEPSGTWRFSTTPITLGSSPGDATFRRTTWGASRESVRTSEADAPAFEDPENLAYEVRLDNKDCLLIYRFFGDSLTSASYVLKADYVNKNGHLSDFDSLLGLLEKKYGAHPNDTWLWLGDLYRDDPDNWGDAVGYGELMRVAEWVNDEVKITLLLSGENFEVHHSIRFEFQPLQASASEAISQATLEDL